MGNEDTQTQEDTAWAALDASGDAIVSGQSFGDPLDWPDAMAWERFLEGDVPTEAVSIPDDFGVDELFDSVWRSYDEPAEPAEGDGNGGGGAPTDLQFEHVDETLWAGEQDDTSYERETVVIGALGGAAATGPVTGVPIPPAAIAETAAGRRAGRSWWPPRIDVRHGPAAMIALAACVSLILVGMFLSVRARNDLDAKTSEFETSGQLTTESSTSLPRQTIPPTTLAQAPPSTISLSDLIPADAAAAGDTGATSTPTTSRAPATTAAPARTTPTAQPTNTTVAADGEPTSPPPTSPPANDTTSSTRLRTPTSISIPDFDFTIPSFPGSIPTIPRSAFPQTNN